MAIHNAHSGCRRQQRRHWRPRRRPRRPVPTASDFTPIDVGQVVNRTIGESPTECLGLAGWPCQYFRLTAPSNGTLTIELRYIPETQPPGRGSLQVVDVSIVGQNLETWSDYRDPATMALAAGTIDGNASYTPFCVRAIEKGPRVRCHLSRNLTESDPTLCRPGQREHVRRARHASAARPHVDPGRRATRLGTLADPSRRTRVSGLD